MCVFVFFFCLFVCFFWPCLFFLCLVAVKKLAELLRKVIYLFSFLIAWFRVSVDPKLKLSSLLSSVPQDLDLLFFFFNSRLNLCFSDLFT